MTVGLALPTPNGSSIPNPSLDNELLAVPMNSSYRAAWAVSAIDWCKWPMPQQLLGEGGGKMAIGSYIEDAANIVSHGLSLSSQISRVFRVFI